MNRLSKISGFTAALALLSLSHAGYAEDQKTYPGAPCQIFPSEDPDPGVTEILCPIVRDNIANTNGTKAAWVRVLNDGGVFQCTLLSFAPGRHPWRTHRQQNCEHHGYGDVRS